MLVPVVALEPFVRARWAHYEPAWVSTDPAFVHAHVTVLSPFAPEPTAADLDRLSAVAASVPPAQARLETVEEFPDGILHLVPEPVEPFAALTAAAWAAFPQHPPYEGRYGDVVPHLTLDHTMTGESVASVTAALGDLLPLTWRAEHLDLQWYAEGECRLLARWQLGTGVRLR